MRIKKDLVLRQIGGHWVVLPLAAETINFSGILSLNDSGAMLWNVLQDECSVDVLTKRLLAEYEVDEEQARCDAEAFFNKLIQTGCLEDV